MNTLPDLLRPGLDLIFVGINPGLHSARVGRYFAHPRNRFWDAANMGGIFVPPLSPDTDTQALDQGIGFTDIVKRPSSGASDLKTPEFREGAPVLRRKLLEAAPKLVCFNGMTSYANFVRYANAEQDVATASPRPQKHAFGRQQRRIDDAVVFVVPSPSPANASYSLQDLAEWYRQVAELRRELSAR